MDGRLMGKNSHAARVTKYRAGWVHRFRWTMQRPIWRSVLFAVGLESRPYRDVIRQTWEQWWYCRGTRPGRSGPGSSVKPPSFPGCLCSSTFCELRWGRLFNQFYRYSNSALFCCCDPAYRRCLQWRSPSLLSTEAAGRTVLGFVDLSR